MLFVYKDTLLAFKQTVRNLSFVLLIKYMEFERAFFSMIQYVWFTLSYKTLFLTNLPFLLRRTYVSNLDKLVKPSC